MPISATEVESAVGQHVSAATYRQASQAVPEARVTSVSGSPTLK